LGEKKKRVDRKKQVLVYREIKLRKIAKGGGRATNRTPKQVLG